MELLSYLAFAAGQRRVGMIYLEGKELKYWDMSTKAAKSVEEACAFAERMIEHLRPQVVVTEDISTATQKGRHTKSLIYAISKVAENADTIAVSTERRCLHRNKYEEAAELVTRYPDLLPWQPKRRCFFDKEPRSTVLFEALSLAESVQQRPTTDLAAAMG